MTGQGETKNEGIFTQFKSVVLGLSLVAGVGIGLYLVTVICQVALALTLLFLLFPTGATLIAFFGINALLKRVTQCKTPRFISAIIAAVVLGSCVTFQVVTKRYTISEVLFGKTHWSKVVRIGDASQHMIQRQTCHSRESGNPEMNF